MNRRDFARLVALAGSAAILPGATPAPDRC